MRHEQRFTIPKLESRIALISPLQYRRRVLLDPFRFLELDSPNDAPPLNADDSTWEVIPHQSYWGSAYLDFAMSGSFTVPAEFDHDAHVALYLPLGEAGDFSHPEALVYVDGEAFAAVDRHHQEVQLPARWRDGKDHRLLLHGWTGLLGRHNAEPGRKLFMQECAVVQIDTPTRQFVIAARVALETAEVLEKLDPARDRLLNALDAAFIKLDTREPFGDAFYASVPDALKTLRAGIEAAGAPLDVDIVATGHAHIDVAWLWTLGQTRRKAGRTFHTVLRLMEQFPDYHFTQSQPQLYDYVRQDYPELFEAIKERVAEGRWEVIGGMWVEADCNISGGESLARQLILGRAFFKSHFGDDAHTPVLWLPDVFGYAWNLPQLIKLAGLEYFFTIKIGWNQTNRLPYDAFWWQGLDGTQVLTHFSTTPDYRNINSRATYNATLAPMPARGTWLNLQQKADVRTVLMSYGYGDGGGGPTREMLENGRELAHFPGMPRVRQGSVHEFFQALERESGERLPVWNGELYLELHRGTYTTQSRNKRANRKREFLLHDAEFIATLTKAIDPNYRYPQEVFHEAWELVCLNQFHDIIPGSSINAVYGESQQQYDHIRQITTEARDAALEVLVSKTGSDVLLINPTSFHATNEIARFPAVLPDGLTLQYLDGRVIPTQPDGDGTLFMIEQGLPPFSVTPLVIVGGAAPTFEGELIAEPYLLENAFLRVELNEAGDITRIYDKYHAREVLPPGRIANEWQAFEDRPNNWDAWDIDIHYDDKMYTAQPAESITLVESGPIHATIEIKRRILNSSYTQRFSLAAWSHRVEFDTTIDWRERHVLLKTAFPVDVLSPRATYEIQWGHVERPTHKNTSWDWARFEVAAQKWAALHEEGFGVALLNDCKYGYDIHDNVIRLSLLRSPTSPDPEADQGEHQFKYALYVHEDYLDYIIREAYLFNDPLIVHPGNGEPPLSRLDSSLFTVVTRDGSENVVIETVKAAEDGNGYIVRLYQPLRKRGRVILETAFLLGEAAITNLLEETITPLEIDGRRVSFEIAPFQIVTLRLVPEQL